MDSSRRTFLGVTAGAAALTMVHPLADAVALSDQNLTSSTAAPSIVRVQAAPAQVLNSFDPDKSLATSMDIQSREAINRIYTPETVSLCLSAGWDRSAIACILQKPSIIGAGTPTGIGRTKQTDADTSWAVQNSVNPFAIHSATAFPIAVARTMAARTEAIHGSQMAIPKLSGRATLT